MIIDFHCHAFPDHLADHAMTSMVGNTGAHSATNGSVSALKASMKEAGIDLSVILPVATNPNKLTTMNNISLEHDPADGLLYFGGVHPLAPNRKEELERLAAGGIKGVKIHPPFQQLDITAPEFMATLEQCAELGLIVVAHTGPELAFPDTEYSAPSKVRQMLLDLKGLKFVGAHMGGCTTYEECMEHYADLDCMMDVACLLPATGPLAIYFDMMSDEDVVRCVRELGVERFVFGSDIPWFSQVQMRAAFDRLPLTEEERAAILGDNAQKLLGL